MRRRYTRQQKMAAVAEAEVNGAEAASESTGIPRRTIGYWLDHPEFAELRQKTREEQRDGYRVLIAKAQERLVSAIPTMEPRDVTILLGVAQDKDLLLSGDATARSESRDLTHDLDRDTRRRIADWFDRNVATDTGADGGVPEDAGTGVRESAAG